MCYNNCTYFWWNPLTGNDGCSRPGPCVEDVCSYCGEELDSCECICEVCDEYRQVCECETQKGEDNKMKGFLIKVVIAWMLCLLIGFFISNSRAAETDSTTMTIIKTGSWWPNPSCASPPAVIDYEITERMSDVRIAYNGLHWAIDPGNTFIGGYARLWAFWSDNGGKTWFSSGWDYTTNSSTFKVATGYGDGNDWVGQMISTICDQSQCPKDPEACNGRQRSNIIFVPNPDDRETVNSALTILPEDVGVFYELEEQQFKANMLENGNVVDVTDSVDWYIEEYPFADQEPGAIEINESGLATIKDTWGRVNISACYPKGCYNTPPPPPPPPEPEQDYSFLQSIYLLIME